MPKNLLTRGRNWIQRKTLEVTSSDIARKVTNIASKSFKTIEKNQSKIFLTLGGFAKGSAIVLVPTVLSALPTLGLSLLAVPVVMAPLAAYWGWEGFAEGSRNDNRKANNKKRELLNDFKTVIEEVEIPDCEAIIGSDEVLNRVQGEESLLREIRCYLANLTSWKTELENDSEIMRSLRIDINNQSQFPEGLPTETERRIKDLLREYKEIIEKEAESCQEIIRHNASNLEEKTEFRKELSLHDDKIAQIEVYNK